jgi:hypothetical protein
MNLKKGESSFHDDDKMNYEFIAIVNVRNPVLGGNE